MKASEEHLPRAIFSAGQVRELDRRAIDGRGIDSYELMTRAASAALAVLRGRWPEARHLLVVCGAGNNAGDGYVLSRLAHGTGLTVRVLAVTSAEKLKGDAARAERECRAAGVPITPFVAGRNEIVSGFVPDVLVDALLGTGLDRELRGDFAAAVERMNAAGLPTLALDIPSGLHADTGLPLGAAVHASLTVTFVGLKQGLFLGSAPDYCGELEFANLKLPPELGDDFVPPLERLMVGDLHSALPRRPRSQHKGASGRLLLVGGAPGTAGAIRLAAEAALRTGAGLVYVATDAASVDAVMAGRPEIMCRAVAGPADLEPLLGSVDAIVIGPGLGQSDWGSQLFAAVLATDRPLVVDADALNLLAAAPVARGRWVLTPHPGEASRLLDRPIAAVQADRLGAARELAERYAAVAVLKGAGTLVATPDQGLPCAVCDRGNPGMATAGMGDVLAGVIGALLVQGGDARTAARAGVLLHALAGDDAARDGERGTVASDLMPHLRRWANPS